MGNTELARGGFEAILFDQVAELGLSPHHVALVDERDYRSIDLRSPLVAIFFGYNGASDGDHGFLRELVRDSIPIIPCVASLSDVSACLPSTLRHINAFPIKDPPEAYLRLVTLIFENLRLLRSERRLFISYRRVEAQTVAIQLYEALDQAGFDVFLDTRSVPYAVDFQGVLWHRMTDSDVVVLLDTPHFRESQWTQRELAQANTTNIQILHLLWPDVAPDRASAFSQFDSLLLFDFASTDQVGSNARLTEEAVTRIVNGAESLRARALAARHRSLVDNFCDRARDCKVRSLAVQPGRFISVELSAGEKIAVVPTVGVPRADLYQEIGTAIRASGIVADQVWLLYDERGLLQRWLEHLDWLNSHLPISALQVSQCALRLGGNADD